MWPQNKMRNHNSTIKWWTIQHHSWISFSGHICVLPSNFDHLLFWWCSGDKMIDDIIFHKLSSILETLAFVQLKWSRTPPWHSHLVWIIPRWLHANLSKWVQQVWNLTDAGRQTWVADECQSWQRHLSSWCYGKAKWLSFLNWESFSDSTLITVMESMVDPSIFPLLIASSILLAILTTSCQSSNVVAVVWELLETFQ